MTTPDSGTAPPVPSRRERLQSLREASLKRPVLANHISDGFNGRWTRRQWAQASLVATIGMLMASIVPGFDAPVGYPQHTPRQSMALALPPLSMSRKRAPVDSWEVVTVERGQTLGALFESLDIPPTTMYRILEHPGTREALTRLRPGAELAFDLPVDGTLRAIRFDRGDDQRVELRIGADAIHETVTERPTQVRTQVASGEIHSSLYVAARKAGLSPAAIATMTDQIFQYDIDFKDTQKGDRFSVVYDEIWREGERIGTGAIRAATFSTGGKTFAGFRFERDGKAEYFTQEGRPLKKSFIRMPIPYARLTSGFGSRRHPIKGKVRMHKGVDYGASSGTPIMAAGDARVQFAGWRGGYGRTVILDHGRGHTTLYAHMSRFGKYKAGQQVRQGETIGFVGSSGLSTGPHLHYEFRINGVHRNPLSVTMPPPEPLKGAELIAFRAQVAPALAQLERIENVRLAQAGPARKANPDAATRPKA
ncbi:peptidoglycan DD-metalloendopeptidase family protein [Lysobacter sp. A3-1-A15]|uniref:peptidoglycan DD-metalloendopeptidase family protein n=1 Tax=Novilysobacter viscosus TaxID=3098602 RepID=UPI002ED80F84